MIPTLLPKSAVCPLLESVAEILAELRTLPTDTPDWYRSDLFSEAEQAAADLQRAISQTQPAFIAADIELFVSRQLDAWEQSAVLDGPARPVETPPGGMLDMSVMGFFDRFPG